MAGQFIAIGKVKETGGVLREHIVADSPRKAVRIAEEWAKENALKLTQVFRLQPLLDPPTRR